jgi:hypothetical protein
MEIHVHKVIALKREIMDALNLAQPKVRVERVAERMSAVGSSDDKNYLLSYVVKYGHTRMFVSMNRGP